MRYVADDCDLQMLAGVKFWFTIQRDYVVLNWRAVCGRPICHHLVVCPVWERETLVDLGRKLLELANA